WRRVRSWRSTSPDAQRTVTSARRGGCVRSPSPVMRRTVVRPND
ncbi:MAG: hypothetical protein AVDCRST_MAG49-1230, partial [uncultured Thermomicrobiales bacterium]